MTIAEFCLPIAVLLYLLPIGWAKASGFRQYDNGNPRDPAFYASGPRARAHGAHVNGMEAFPFFAAAVIVAQMQHASQVMVDVLAVAFIAARIAYVAAYIGDRDRLRSSIWFACLALNLAIFFAPLYAPAPAASGPVLF